MKFTRNILFVAFVLLFSAVSGFSQAASRGCQWKIPLPAVEIDHFSDETMEIWGANHDIESTPGKREIVQIICLVPKSSVNKTPAQVKELLADMVISRLKKAAPDAPVTETPFRLGKYLGTKYSFTRAGGFCVVRVFAVKNKAYAITIVTNTAKSFASLQDVVDKFTPVE